MMCVALVAAVARINSLCHRVRTEGVRRWHQPDLAPTAHRHPVALHWGSTSHSSDESHLDTSSPQLIISGTQRLESKVISGDETYLNADPGGFPEHPEAFFITTMKETGASHHEIIKVILKVAG